MARLGEMQDFRRTGILWPDRDGCFVKLACCERCLSAFVRRAQGGDTKGREKDTEDGNFLRHTLEKTYKQIYK